MTQLFNRDDQRRRVLLALILITFLGGLHFGFLNWSRGLIWAALIEFVFVVWCTVAFPIVLRTRRLKAWSLAMALPWIGAMVAIVSMPGTSETVFIWTLVLPLLLYFLLGERLGLALSALSLGAASVAALVRFGLPQSAEHLAHASNMVVAALAMLVLAHVYERGRRRVEIELHRLAVTDSLTSLPNRSLLYQDFQRQKALSQRTKRPLAVLLMDIDHFKAINDRHGHDAGDQVLVAVAAFLEQRLRGSDKAYRIGGEEFLVVLPNTDLIQARTVAESLRSGIEELNPNHADQLLPITASFGVAELGADGDSMDEVLRHADQRMYWAKANGRNQVRSI